MMEAMWRRLGRTLSHRTARVLAVVVLVTVALAPGLASLDFATGQDSYLEASDPAAIANERYQELFGGEAMVVLLTMEPGRTLPDLFTERNLATFAELEDRFRAGDETFAVVSPVTALTWSSELATTGVGAEILARALERDTDPQGAAARERNDQISLRRFIDAGEASLANRAWVEFLLYDNDGFDVDATGALVSPPEDERTIRPALRSTFPDPRHAVSAVFLIGNASLDELAAGDALVRGALDGVTFDNATVIVTGTPTFLTDINDYLQGGMLTLGLIALVVMVVVLGVAFRVRWRFVPLATVIVGILWGFGAFGLAGLDLSLVTISGLPILIGIGIDFAIQVHNRSEEECALDREPEPFGETLHRLGPPMVVATVAAAIAFLAMQVSRVPMIRDFGVLLAVGIVAMLLAGILVPTAVLGSRERRRPTTRVRPSRIEGAVAWLGSSPPAAVLPFVALALVLPLVGLSLEQDSEIESDPINWADQSSTSVRNARILENETGFATTLGMFIESDGTGEGIFTDEMAAFTHDLALSQLDRHPELVEASSLVTSVSYLIAVEGATSLPPTATDLERAHEVAPPDIQRLLVGDGGAAGQITFWVGPSSLDDRAALMADLEEAVEQPGDRAPLPDGAEATPSGLARVGVGLLENITANRAALWVVALTAVTAWLLLRFLSVGRAVLALLPVVVAVGAASTVISLLGVQLSPLTTVSSPLVIATCAEFSVLIVSRFLEERDRGLEARDASRVASQRTGRAFMASALTTIGGFGVLVFAALPLLRDFGAVVTLNIAIALLAALVIVPPTAVWADRRGLLTTDGRRRALDRAAAAVLGAGFATAAIVVAAVAVS
jgi:uncharacterized protein